MATYRCELIHSVLGTTTHYVDHVGSEGEAAAYVDSKIPLMLELFPGRIEGYDFGLVSCKGCKGLGFDLGLNTSSGINLDICDEEGCERADDFKSNPNALFSAIHRMTEHWKG